MGDLSQLYAGQSLQRFPGDTWNALVRGERRDRQRQAEAHGQLPPEARSAVLVRLAWLGTTDLAPNHVVKLTDPVVEPATDDAVPFNSLAFFCDTPDNSDNNVAITLTPITAEGVGYGFIPQATWAKVNVNNSLDEFCSPDASSTLLESAGQGRFPILWKETGTGEKWAVILLASGAGGSTLQWGAVTVEVPAGDPDAPTTGGEVQFYKNDGANDGSPVAVDNAFPLVYEVGWAVCCDRGQSPPRVVTGTCTPA